MAKHRTFNADRFLDKLENHEHLLRAFLAPWSGQLDLKVDGLTIPKFKKWLVDGKEDCKDEILEALYQVYDLCTERGHEDLFAACAAHRYDPDPDHELPVECLSLKVRAEKEEVFSFAYGRYSFFRAERFTIFQGERGKEIKDIDKAIRRFLDLLGQQFKDHKGSARLLVRHYEEAGYVNVIVYHEKRTKATLILGGPSHQPKVQARIFRPAQQDFISYNPETGQVEIEAGFQNEETKLRQCFAEACFGDRDFFDGPHAANRFDLGPIADASFQLRCPSGITARLIELRFAIPQAEDPKFGIRSRDVLQTLARNGLRSKLDGDSIGAAVFKITFPDDQRGKRVELSGSNRIKFKRATHAEEIFSLLLDWGILLTEHDHADTAELRDAKAAFAGSANRLAP